MAHIAPFVYLRRSDAVALVAVEVRALRVVLCQVECMRTLRARIVRELIRHRNYARQGRRRSAQQLDIRFGEADEERAIHVLRKVSREVLHQVRATREYFAMQTGERVEERQYLTDRPSFVVDSNVCLEHVYTSREPICITARLIC